MLESSQYDWLVTHGIHQSARQAKFQQKGDFKPVKKLKKKTKSQQEKYVFAGVGMTKQMSSALCFARLLFRHNVLYVRMCS